MVKAAGPGGKYALVKLAGNDGVLDEQIKRDDPEGVLVGGFEDDRAGGSSLLNLQPPGGTDAPAVTWLETSEPKLGHGGAEVVAEGLGGFEEGSVDDTADGVDAEVFGAGLAAAGAVKAGHGLAAADFERLAEDVFAAILGGFGRGHLVMSPLSEPVSHFFAGDGSCVGVGRCELFVFVWPALW